MHKKSIELAKKCLDEICMIGNPTAEEWQNFFYCMKGCAAGVCAEKDFKSIEAMEEAKKEQDAMKLIGTVVPEAPVPPIPAMPGYNNRRYQSGRYAPAGRGHVSGFYPYYAMEDDDFIQGYVNDPNFARNMRMGYTDGGQSNGQFANGRMNVSAYDQMGNGNNSYGFNDGMDMPRYGRSYQSYRSARKHYTESNDPAHKARMKAEAEEVFGDIEDMTMDIIKDMAPEDKVKYKAKLQQIMSKM